MIKIRKKKKNEINLIPMINIVFLLLIFFMITGTISPKINPDVYLPYSEFSKKKDLKQEYLNIDINKFGIVFFINNEISLQKLENLISKTSKKKKIVLNIHKESRINELKKIIKILKKYNFQKIFISTSIKK